MRYLSSLFFIIILVIFSLLTFNLDQKLINVKNDKIKLCSELNYQESLNLHPDNFKEFGLSVKIHEMRKWRRIILEEEIIRTSSEWTHFYNNKRRVKSSFEVIIKPNLKCLVLADIRIHGDMRDHRRGSGLPSLNVKLTDGHIFGIVDFILFRPITRNFDNEIFATTLFRELGLLAPRSSNVKVHYNNQASNFIFQEKIVKEFLENSSLRESAIYEGDERFIAYDSLDQINLSRHRLINRKWAEKGMSNQFISETALSILNEINHYYRNEVMHDPYEVIDYFTLGKKFGMEDYLDKIPLFDSIIYAIEAEHCLSRDDRRFYYDPTIRKFYPIYYDGMTNLLTKNNKILDLPISYENNFNVKSHIRTGKVTPSAIYGSEGALKLVKKLNIENLYNKLQKNGVKLKKEQVKRLINIIENRLLLIRNFNKNKIFKINFDTEVRTFMPKDFVFNNNSKRRFIYYGDSFENYLSCNIYGHDCKNIFLNKKKKARAIAQELKDEENNDLIFVGKKRNKIASKGWFSHYSLNEKFKKNKIKQKKISKDVNLIVFGNVDFTNDKSLRTTTLNKKDSTGSILFLGGTLDNWKIVFKDESNKTNKLNSRSDENGFTGCISFYDISLQNISIETSDSQCEDAVNFVRSEGTIKNLLIRNSLFDSLDADFSSLKFQSIEIRNSKNDCIDLSYGSYFLNNIKAEFCGDKAISIGEASDVKIKNLFISNSNIGLAVKDFGTADIKNAEIYSTKSCVEAYNKKQEFSGGYVFSNKLYCRDSLRNSWSDKKSLLKVNFL